jgi:hypothetical protein
VDVDKREGEERGERLRCVALIASCVFTTSVLVLVWSGPVLSSLCLYVRI